MRDWGYAPEYVEAMWRMLQVDEPNDYVVATGVSYSIEHFVELRLRAGRSRLAHVRRTDPAYLRPAEVDNLFGDARRQKPCSAGKPRRAHRNWPA